MKSEENRYKERSEFYDGLVKSAEESKSYDVAFRMLTIAQTEKKLYQFIKKRNQ